MSRHVEGEIRGKHSRDQILTWTRMQSIENPSVWGIFELPDIESCIDERVVLIGDAVSLVIRL